MNALGGLGTDGFLAYPNQSPQALSILTGCFWLDQAHGPVCINFTCVCTVDFQFVLQQRDFIPLRAGVVLVHFQNISEAPGPLPALQILSPERWETPQPGGLGGVGELSLRSLICKTELMVVPLGVMLRGKPSVQGLACT